MKRAIVAILLLVGASISVSITTVPTAAQAQATSQEVVWVQIEAQPSLTAAQERARAYASSLPDVNGFSLGGGWYGIALGPYLPNDAREVLRVYRREGQIPRDSYIAYSSAFRQQFYPLGANILDLPAPEPAAISEAEDTQTEQASAAESSAEETPVTEPAPEPQIVAADETPAQARAAESALDREEREKLQVALKWAGFYDASIDGAFGRGTRRSMAEWQEANNYEVTGILTTAQRAALITQYNAILDGLGMQTVTDATAGIALTLPTEVVSFAKYSPPFAHYDATGDMNARVLLISQEGDQNTLYGLYDIMQTLEIVPESGPRERNRNSFTLIGESAMSISHTQAWLEGGEIKGFTLIWPAGDEERRRRVLSEMMASFTRLEGAMDPAAGTDEQNIDLVSGLEIRRPKMSRSGFFIDAAGHVVTTSQAVASCGRITLADDFDAEVLTNDSEAGIAILKAAEALSPPQIAQLSLRVPRLQSEVAVAGFSYEGILTAPTLTFGRLSDVKGLAGEPRLKRLALNALPGDAGGPVFDDSGSVMGMLLPAEQDGKKLPDEVSFAVDAETIRAVAEAAGIVAKANNRTGRIAPEDLTSEAEGLTVLVSCWE